jgi:hypothetical protein
VIKVPRGPEMNRNERRHASLDGSAKREELLWDGLDQLLLLQLA